VNIEAEHIRRAVQWDEGPLDRATANWIDALVRDVMAWVQKNRARLQYRSGPIVAALAHYQDLPAVIDTVERVSGKKFN